jgi:hypothetical protein
MGRMVIEVPEELTELGKAMAEQLAEVQRAMARQGGGKAVDYALVEQAVWAAAGRTEREAHRAILQSLDIGRTLTSLEHLNETAALWLADIADVHLQRETKRPPTRPGACPSAGLLTQEPAAVVDTCAAGKCEWFSRSSRAGRRSIRHCPFSPFAD